MKNKIPKEIKRRKGKSFAIINKIRENEFYKMGFKAGQKQTKDAFKEMIESCDEEPCCHGIQKNELLSKINSQHPRIKQTRGGELKSDEGLHSTEYGFPADTFSKEDSEDTCICGHHTKDHSYDPNKLDADLECDICDCKGFRTKEDRSFLGGYAELWDNPEDNRWDKEEEKQDE